MNGHEASEKGNVLAEENGLKVDRSYYKNCSRLRIISICCQSREIERRKSLRGSCAHRFMMAATTI